MMAALRVLYWGCAVGAAYPVFIIRTVVSKLLAQPVDEMAGDLTDRYPGFILNSSSLHHDPENESWRMTCRGRRTTSKCTV